MRSLQVGSKFTKSGVKRAQPQCGRMCSPQRSLLWWQTGESDIKRSENVLGTENERNKI